jgi:hypothetical protein
MQKFSTNTSKPNPTVYQKDHHDQVQFTPGTQECFNVYKSSNMILPVKMNDKNMIITLYAERG